MLKTLWTLLFGKKKPKYPKGPYFVAHVLNENSHKIVYEADSYTDAEKFAKSKVQHVDDKYYVLHCMSTSSFEVKMKASK